MMIPFKGHHSAKMFMPKKPVKWGYKLWCRAGVSGYVYDFEVVGGNGAKGPPPNMKSNLTFGESEYVVLRLTQDLQSKKHKVFFDNLSTSRELLIQLKSSSIFAVRTQRKDRTRGCPLPTERSMRQQGQGSMSEFTDNAAGLVICAWFDNRQILTISDFL